MDFILVDGSYYTFYRYFAMMSWWGLAKPDEELGIPIENKDFVEKFNSTFISKFKEIEKKLKIKGRVIKIVARDCPRQDIWRMSLFDTYKACRDKDDGFLGGPFFKLAYNAGQYEDTSRQSLFHQAGAQTVIMHPRLEADDCIAITTKHIIEKYPDARVWIIASDMDYLQLASDRVSIYNLKYKDITKSKNATGDAECDKFCKIVCGDKSDDIPGVFKKCGPKTALKYYNDRELFEKKLEKEEGARERYNRNKKLVDFNCIPGRYKHEFETEVLGLNGGVY